MAMNFWEAQAKARLKTKIYLATFVFITLFVATTAELAMRYFAPDVYAPDFPIIGPAFLGITFIVAWYNYSMYSFYGGAYVAESVGARLVDPNTDRPKERQLLNIVEEVALACSQPVPAVYIIPAEQINAFAAGLTPDKAVIAVTEGALEILNRDELQGVIAHEFGHINNGDMRIGLQLAAMIMGFFFVLYLGFRVLQFSGMRRGSRSSSDSKGGGNPVMLAAVILLVAGIFTWIAGSILKCTVSRQREYLADASAVQYTRNPSGIANALRKIAKDTVSDMPKEGMAFSHMYLEEHSLFGSLFSTHPPIEKRIAAIEGREV